MVTTYAAHDLLRVDPAIARRWPHADAWVGESIRRAPWLVVRRGCSDSDVPIGVRGSRRAERFAARIAQADVRESLAPEALGRGVVANPRLGGVFDRLTEFALGRSLRISPIGSYGFELASGVRTTHAASDLDVIVAAGGVPRETLRALALEIEALFAESGVRIDVELAYAAGGAALLEVLSGAERVMFKTDGGPELLPCPV